MQCVGNAGNDLHHSLPCGRSGRDRPHAHTSCAMEETMKVMHPLAFATTAVLLFSVPAWAGKPQAKAAKSCFIAGWENPPSVCATHTKVVAATCYNCHGPNATSSPAIPGLAGQDKEDFVTAMKEVRDGKRENTVMQRYAIGYTDDEYEALGEFFAKIK